MTTTTVDVIVLGTGAAAQSLVYTCREAGWSVAIVDYHPFGGTCPLRGCDPKKVLFDVSDLVDWSRRMQGKGLPVTVWIVRHGDDLYVRSVRGRSGHWFRGTQERHEGRIRAGRVQKDVTFVDADHDIDDDVDAAYRAKYRRYAGSILNGVLTAEARSTTIKLAPRSARI